MRIMDNMENKEKKIIESTIKFVELCKKFSSDLIKQMKIITENNGYNSIGMMGALGTVISLCSQMITDLSLSIYKGIKKDIE